MLPIADTKWALQFMKRIKKKTGNTGAVYASYNRYKMGGFDDLIPPEAKSVFGGRHI
jgi:hypothetical protein